MTLFRLLVDFLYEVAKDCERVCEAVLVNVLGDVESRVIIARKIEVHRRHTHALEAAFCVCRRVRCAQSDASFLARYAFFFARFEPYFGGFGVALDKPVHILVIDEHMVLLAQSVEAKYGRGAIFEIVFVRLYPRFCAAQTCLFAACADATDFGVFKSDISIVNKLFSSTVSPTLRYILTLALISALKINEAMPLVLKIKFPDIS